VREFGLRLRFIEVAGQINQTVIRACPTSTGTPIVCRLVSIAEDSERQFH
jgi:hypothetical protein